MESLGKDNLAQFRLRQVHLASLELDVLAESLESDIVLACDGLQGLCELLLQFAHGRSEVDPVVDDRSDNFRLVVSKGCQR